ncbi:hypothetical protein BDV25DRAFT_31668 [Aspergillus avenaceus]|uniref:DUF1918 domain-containing protein n=1 Tax=Aspergillus avenaceus TaxID=36643 RepID=A0A5N6U456_ASPAV|nr:hypothetical protein BDV25DRAFT_31668 [Aspergillus avenaceus]
MRASVGDTVELSNNATRDRSQCEIIEVVGVNGAPPYRVRFSDGHESLIFPGPDAVVRRGEDG